MVKHVGTLELLVVVAAVLAVIADSVLITHNLFKTRCLSGDRPSPTACAQSRAKKKPGGGKYAGEKGRG